jgi:hypothetical protein
VAARKSNCRRQNHGLISSFVLNLYQNVGLYEMNLCKFGFSLVVAVLLGFFWVVYNLFISGCTVLKNEKKVNFTFSQKLL